MKENPFPIEVFIEKENISGRVYRNAKENQKKNPF